MGNSESLDPVKHLPPELADPIVRAWPNRDANRDMLANACLAYSAKLNREREKEMQGFRDDLWKNTQAELAIKRQALEQKLRADNDAAFRERERRIALADADCIRERRSLDEREKRLAEQTMAAQADIAKAREELNQRAKELQEAIDALRREKETLKKHLIPEKTVLNVGGITYETTRSTLTVFEDSFFGALLSGRHPLRFEPDGRLFIDRPGEVFVYILQYLRSGAMCIPVHAPAAEFDSLLQQLRLELDYYQIDCDLQTQVQRAMRAHSDAPQTKAFLDQRLLEELSLFNRAAPNVKRPARAPGVPLKATTAPPPPIAKPVAAAPGPTPAAHTPAPIKVNPKWKCRHCSFAANFASNTACYKCKAPRE